VVGPTSSRHLPFHFTPITNLSEKKTFQISPVQPKPVRMAQKFTLKHCMLLNVTTWKNPRLPNPPTCTVEQFVLAMLLLPSSILLTILAQFRLAVCASSRLRIRWVFPGTAPQKGIAMSEPTLSGILYRDLTIVHYGRALSYRRRKRNGPTNNTTSLLTAACWLRVCVDRTTALTLQPNPALGSGYAGSLTLRRALRILQPFSNAIQPNAVTGAAQPELCSA